MDIIIEGKKSHAATGGRKGKADEPAVVFIHGAGMDRTAWQLQSRNIAHNGCRVFAVDLPGHGRSEGPPLKSIAEMADWVALFMDASETESAIIVGHSMGALIGLEVAARHPLKVNKLVLIGVAEKMPVHPDLLAAAKANQPLGPELVVFWGLGNNSQIGGHRQPGLWVQGASITLLMLSKSGVLGNDLAASNSYQDGLKAAEKISCPVKLILSENDKMTPLNSGVKLGQAIANVGVDIIPNCGHMIMLERSEEVYKSMKGFVF